MTGKVISIKKPSPNPAGRGAPKKREEQERQEWLALVASEFLSLEDNFKCVHGRDPFMYEDALLRAGAYWAARLHWWQPYAPKDVSKCVWELERVMKTLGLCPKGASHEVL